MWAPSAATNNMAHTSAGGCVSSAVKTRGEHQSALGDRQHCRAPDQRQRRNAGVATEPVDRQRHECAGRNPGG